MQRMQEVLHVVFQSERTVTACPRAITARRRWPMRVLASMEQAVDVVRERLAFGGERGVGAARFRVLETP